MNDTKRKRKRRNIYIVDQTITDTQEPTLGTLNYIYTENNTNMTDYTTVSELILRFALYHVRVQVTRQQTGVQKTEFLHPQYLNLCQLTMTHGGKLLNYLGMWLQIANLSYSACLVIGWRLQDIWYEGPE